MSPGRSRTAPPAAPPAPPPPELVALRDAWLAQWPRALDVWSRLLKLSEPRWCLTPEDEKKYGLSDSFAMIRLTDQAVVIGLERARAMGVEGFAREVLAHEIGHHVFVPANMLDQGRMLARMRRALPTKEALAPLVANLYADLLINDRLQRDAGLDIAGVYRVLARPDATDKMWTLYMRIYEILWSLPRGSLAAAKTDDKLEADAVLGARLVRSFARDWLDGAGRFAALCLPYLMEDDGAGIRKILKGWLDTQNCGH